MTLADRVVVMTGHGGMIEQVGAPNDLYHLGPRRLRFVAGFIGSPAMNA
jgi:ABC-type sugar transport system ATPase subunit